jgi:hypothetical protein
LAPALFLSVAIAAAALPSRAQANPRLQAFFRDNIGLSPDQIAEIQTGKPVVVALQPRSPAEVFLFGAVYVHAAPESYMQLRRDFNRFRKLPSFMALGVFESPPQLRDLNGFALDWDDVRDVQKCHPGECIIQLPGSTMEELHRSIDWSDPDLSQRVNQFLQGKALDLVLSYQREGNRALGVYNDKRGPTEVAQQFAYMLSYETALPAILPEFYRYLLTYPDGKPANVEDRFYWAKVRFGLRSTLRVIHLMILRGSPADDIAYAIVEKQLYASHYFDTALHLTFCVRARHDPASPGFYLVTTMGAEQSALAGFRGGIIRSIGVPRSVSDLQSVLMSIRKTLEESR